jgi:hypothetical protein
LSCSTVRCRARRELPARGLLDNEEGRVSVDDEGLTAAGGALSKIGADEQERLVERLADDGTARD